VLTFVLCAVNYWLFRARNLWISSDVYKLKTLQLMVLLKFPIMLF